MPEPEAKNEISKPETNADKTSFQVNKDRTPSCLPKDKSSTSEPVIDLVKSPEPLVRSLKPVVKLAKLPESVVELAKTPALVVELVKTPEPVVERDKTPEAVIKLLESPEPDVELIKTREPVVGLMKILEPVVKQVRTPEPVIELVESPEPDVELIKAPEAVFELVSSPEPVVGLVKTPEPVVELVKLPSSEQVAFPLKSTWSKPEEVKVKTPESSEGHTGRIKSPRSAEKQPYKPVQSPFPQTTETLISLEGELVDKICEICGLFFEAGQVFLQHMDYHIKEKSVPYTEQPAFEEGKNEDSSSHIIKTEDFTVYDSDGNDSVQSETFPVLPRNSKADITNSVQTLKKDRIGKHDYQKLHACLYCGQLDLKISRHLTSKHQEETAIARLPPVSKDRQCEMQKKQGAST